MASINNPTSKPLSANKDIQPYSSTSSRTSSLSTYRNHSSFSSPYLSIYPSIKPLHASTKTTTTLRLAYALVHSPSSPNHHSFLPKQIIPPSPTNYAPIVVSPFCASSDKIHSNGAALTISNKISFKTRT